MIVNNEQISVLKTYLDVDKYIKAGDLNGLLDELDDVITDVGFNKNYELNKKGLQLQKIFDQIYGQNLE